MKKLLTALLLFPLLAFGQAYGPPFVPSNVNITGGYVGSNYLYQCKGSADDVGINAAITKANAAGGGTVTVSGTNCDITAAVVMQSYVCLAGQGMGKTVLTMHANSTYGDTTSNVIFAKASNSADLTQFCIRDLTVDGNRSNQTTYAPYGKGLGSIDVRSLLPITISGSNNTLTYVIDGAGGTRTATIASATYSTLQSFVAAVNTAVNTAYNNSYATQDGTGHIIVWSFTGNGGSVSSIGGNFATAFIGTPTYLPGTSDNAYDGIVIRGSSNSQFTANKFVVQNVEARNSMYHGMAIYDGAKEFAVDGGEYHHNGYRCLHVHALSTNGTAPSYRLRIHGIRCHDDGNSVFLGSTAGTGLFAFFEGVRDVILSNNQIWNEPFTGMDISGNAGGTANLAQELIASGNEVRNSGIGIQVGSGTFSTNTLDGVTLSNNRTRDISYAFILGSSAAGLTITTGTNDTLTVTIGGTTNNVVIPGATYGSAAALASAVQTAINTAFATSGHGVTVSAPATPSGYIYMVPVFSDGLINHAFSVAAPGSQSAFATVFGSSPTQYGGTSVSGNYSSGNCITVLSSGGSVTNLVMNANAANYCAGWGMNITGGSGKLLTNVAITGNQVNLGGLDYTVSTGGVTLNYVKGFTFNGNSIFGSGTLASGGMQLYINSNVTQGAVVGNYLDTGSTSSSYLPLNVNTGSYNVFLGNAINRNNGTGNQWSDSGTGNIFEANMQGSAGGGGFAFSGTKTTVLTATTASLGGSALTAGQCVSNTTTVNGASTIMTATVTPNTYPGDGNYYFAYVSAANTVTTKVCAAVAGTPTASTYNIRVQI